jgi:hypothetical protein
MAERVGRGSLTGTVEGLDQDDPRRRVRVDSVGDRRQRREAAPVIHSPSPAAERMRAFRKRRRQGMHCIRISLHDTQIEGLIRKGLLRREDRGDLEALQWAIDALLDTVMEEKV